MAKLHPVLMRLDTMTILAIGLSVNLRHLENLRKLGFRSI